jgi:hypothetical protein
VTHWLWNDFFEPPFPRWIATKNDIKRAGNIKKHRVIDILAMNASQFVSASVHHKDG